MQLTQEVAASYKGGQIEVQNPDEEYIYRGEIATITVQDEGEDATLKVTFNWMAKGEGFPPLPSRWVNDDRLTYDAILMIYTITDIGDGRIMLTSFIIGETVVLFSPDGSKLDPSRVEGLNLEEVTSRS